MPFKTSKHIDETSLGRMREQASKNQGILAPVERYFLDRVSQTLQGKRIALATRIFETETGGGELISSALMQGAGSHKKGELITALSARSFGHYESPTIVMPVDEHGHPYPGFSYQIAFSVGGKAHGIDPVQNPITSSNQASVSLRFSGHTLLAMLVPGETNPHQLPHVMTYTIGVDLAEIENKTAHTLFGEHDSNVLLMVSFGQFSNVHVDKQEHGKRMDPKVHGHPGTNEEPKSTIIFPPADAPLPGVMFSKFRQKERGHILSNTFGVVDYNGVMYGGAVLKATVVEGRALFFLNRTHKRE